MTREQKRDQRFSNLAASEIHLAFHSLLTEVSSARDYLASIAALHVHAPTRVDALNRLTDWLEKPINSHNTGDPIVALILEAADQQSADCCLSDITAYRNLFLHNQPLGSDENARWLKLVSGKIRTGEICKILMQVVHLRRRNILADAIELFSDLYIGFCELAGSSAAYALYSSEPICYGPAD